MNACQVASDSVVGKGSGRGSGFLGDGVGWRMRWVGRVHPLTDDSTVVGYAVVDGGGRMRSVDG